MRVLLDGHVALWWLQDNDALGAQCHQLIEDADEVYFLATTP